MTSVPAVCKETTDLALRRMAVVKLALDHLRAEEKALKTYLLEAMNPGDRLTGIDDNNAPVVSVSMSKPRVTGGLVIVDPLAFAIWLDAKGEKHPGKPSVVFPEWFEGKDNLEIIMRKYDGELPDGVEDTTTERAPSLSVRQSDAQKAATLAAMAEVRALLEAATFTENTDEKEGAA